MKTRILTGVSALVIVVYLIGWSPRWLFMAALLALTEGGLYEFFFISQRTGLSAFTTAGYAAGALVCLARWPGLNDGGLLALVFLAVVFLLILAAGVWKSSDLHGYSASVSVTVLAVFYVAFNLSCLFSLRFSALGSALASGRRLVLFLLIVIVAGDIFAYATGRWFGRRHIFPRVSPNKTLEGAVGGLAASVISGWIYARWFCRPSELGLLTCLALLVAVAGQLGDLVESALKRSANLKDSGIVLPGHGGLLDRIDSMLFGAPALWLALVLRNMLH
ncbi:MAG: phosphatidate cytidylyltransferase [Terriglobia bacterium]